MSDIENCFKCGQTPDDILMLTCNHDLCLYCAAQCFGSQSKTSVKRNLICEICQAQTELDSSSISELQKIYEDQRRTHQTDSSPVSQHKKQKTSYKSNTQHKHLNSIDNTVTNFQLGEKENLGKSDYQSRYSIQHSHRNTSKDNLELKNQKDVCPDHPEEDLYYFCFTCLCHCVCPECVIHGVHREHDVKTIKKSYPLVKAYLESTIDQNTQVLQQIQCCKEEIEKRNTMQSQLVSKFKYQIQQEFEVLHQVLNDQEKLLLDSLNAIPTMLQRYEPFTQHCKQVDHHIRSLNATITKQFQFKEETKLLNFYSEFSKIQLPKIEQLPNHTEPQTNHADIMESLALVRRNIESVALQIYTQNLSTSSKAARFSSDEYAMFMNESLKTIDKKLYDGK